uniref:Uncharacterized protein n=1 Tax=Anguilla anguilla TaxID=7936 RepID=A0A0E9U3X3_ANGAN
MGKHFQPDWPHPISDIITGYFAFFCQLEKIL